MARSGGQNLNSVSGIKADVSIGTFRGKSISRLFWLLATTHMCWLIATTHQFWLLVFFHAAVTWALLPVSYKDSVSTMLSPP